MLLSRVLQERKCSPDDRFSKEVVFRHNRWQKCLPVQCLGKHFVLYDIREEPCLQGALIHVRSKTLGSIQASLCRLNIRFGYLEVGSTPVKLRTRNELFFDDFLVSFMCESSQLQRCLGG